MLRRTIVTLIIGLAAAPAAAGGSFFWMNDLSLESKAGLAFSLGNPPSAAGDALVLTTDAVGTWRLGRNLNLAARLPIALAFFDEPADEDSAAAIGNIGVGLTGIRVTRSGGTTIRLGGGGQVYVPTASDSGDSGVAASAAGLLHIPDPGRWADATTLRGRGDFAISAGRLTFQAEANLDLHFRDGDDDIDLNLGLGPSIRLTWALAILAELSIANITDDEILVIDLGMRYRSRSLLIGAKLYLPTEEIAGQDVFGAGFEIGAVF